MLILLILFILICLSFTAENRLIQPKIIFSHRKKNGSVIHILAVLIVFSSLFILFRRPLFTACLSLGLHLILIAINQAKYQTLKEPMVFSDIVMFSQAFKFPRLYFPFIHTGILMAAPLLGLSLFYAGINLETPINTYNWLAYSLGLIALNIGMGVYLYQLAKQQKLTLKPSQDLQQLGFLSSLLVGTIHARQTNHKENFHTQLKNTPFSNLKKPSTLADVIVVQSESFFDVRRLYPDISPNILKNYDAIRATSYLSGQLNVPAWGANTMRSEFAFLTAANEKDLGLFRYYPYHYLQQNIPSIASHYKELGYKTVCIHPHPAEFFERKRVFPLLGFDEFIDIKSFNSQHTVGAYISDKAVADKIIELQSKSKQPLFIFAITMENHGPLHLEKIAEHDKNPLYQKFPEFENHDLSVYLRHLQNADKMLLQLTTHLQQQHKASILCFYGDHVPSIPSAYKALNFNNSQSDYLIWHNQFSQFEVTKQNIPIRDLGLKLTTLTSQ